MVLSAIIHVKHTCERSRSKRAKEIVDRLIDPLDMTLLLAGMFNNKTKKAPVILWIPFTISNSDVLYFVQVTKCTHSTFSRWIQGCIYTEPDL